MLLQISRRSAAISKRHPVSIFIENLRVFSTKNAGSFEEAIVGSNPMFPRPAARPNPEGPGGHDNKSGSSKEGSATDDEHWLSRHASKIGWTALFVTTGMITSYYKSYRAKVDMEDQLISEQSVEPNEINEVRYDSIGMDNEVFAYIAQEAYNRFCSGGLDPTTCLLTYGEFLSFLKPILKEKNVHIHGGHVLDRVIDSLLAQNVHRHYQKSTLEVEVEHADTPEVTAVVAEFPLLLLLTLISMAAQNTASQRVDTLFDVATASPSDKRSATQCVDPPEYAQPPKTPYIAAETFRGRKEGYVFKLGDYGMGYYIDHYGIQLHNERLKREYENRLAQAVAQENADDQMSEDSAERLLEYLQQTCQIPPEKQIVTTGVKYPVEVFRKKLPADMIRSWKRESKLQGPTRVDSGGNRGEGPKEAPSSMLTRAQVRELVLGVDVCAWGECWRRRGGL